MQEAPEVLPRLAGSLDGAFRATRSPAALAALAGGLYASVSGFVAPDLVGLLLATQAIVHVALGGRGSLAGPVVATVIVTRFQQEVSSFSYALWPLLLGTFFIASPNPTLSFTESQGNSE